MLQESLARAKFSISYLRFIWEKIIKYSTFIKKKQEKIIPLANKVE